MSKRGRPTKYTDPAREKILQLLKEGKTEDQVAEILGICRKTLSNWKGSNPELLYAVNESKAVADELVEVALFRRATGYLHPEEKVFCTKDETGAPEIVTHKTEKHYPPDTQAMMFWLRNRQPDRWREKNESDVNVSVQNNVGTLTDEQLDERLKALLEKLTPKAPGEPKPGEPQ